MSIHKAPVSPQQPEEVVPDPGGVVTAVSRGAEHTFSESNLRSVRLLASLGVEGAAHLGKTVKHRSRVAVDPT